MKQDNNNLLPTVEQVYAFGAMGSFDEHLLLQMQRNAARMAYAQSVLATVCDDMWRFSPALTIAWDQLSVQAMRAPMIDLGDGAIMCDVRDFITLHPEVFATTNTFAHKHIIGKLTQAAWNYGVIVYVPRGVKIIKPIDLQTIVNYTASLLIEHITIIVEEGAHVTIHDMTPAHMDTYHVIRSVEVLVYDYAQITFVHHQDRPVSTHEFSALHFYLGNYSGLQYASLVTGGQYNKSWLDVVMRGEHAQADIRGVWLLDGDRTVDIATRQQHSGAQNTSKLRIKSAVRDHARSVYRGTVHVAVDARGTYAGQENKNILLSERACAYSIPNLEALNNDIYCAHGTAVGQLDEEQLLYMQARGIAYKQAQRMLLQGFLADAIPDYLSELVHAAYSARVAQWLDI